MNAFNFRMAVREYMQHLTDMAPILKQVMRPLGCHSSSTCGIHSLSLECCTDITFRFLFLFLLFFLPPFLFILQVMSLLSYLPIWPLDG